MDVYYGKLQNTNKQKRMLRKKKEESKNYHISQR